MTMDLDIKQNLCPESKYSVKCPHAMTPVGVCIHNTANDAPAQNEISYMLGNDDQVSFHYAVDDKEIIQAIPLNRNAWHAGDGGSGEGNRKYIAIEICYSKSGGPKFEAAIDNAAQLTAKLLTDYGWDISHVKKHQDFSGKHCPHRILDEYGWDNFLSLVQAKLKEDSSVAKFADTAGHWAETAIDELAEMGIVHGNDDGSFEPDKPATKAEVATMVRYAIKYITGK